MNDFICGYHPVREALLWRADGVQEIWLDEKRKDTRLLGLRRMARDQGISVHEAPATTLKTLTPGVRHQGVVARYAGPRSYTETDLPQILAAGQQPALLLVLDGIQDPHNLGACLRSADAASADAVIAPKDRAVGLTPAVGRVASGAAQTIPFIPVANLARTLRALKKAGIWLFGASGDAPQTLFDADLKVPLALVLGAEQDGLRRLTREHCDALVSIPMAGAVESLNASVAAGVCLFEVVRQRSCPAMAS